MKADKKIAMEKLFISVLLMSALLTPSFGVAATRGSSETASKVEQDTQKQLEEKRKRISSEAIFAINETRNALLALDHGKKQDALSALERATGKLDVLFAREPRLTLAPIEVSAVTTDIGADVKTIKNLRRQAMAYLSDGQMQAARHLLRDLASETIITVVNIPLGTYPGALKEAAKLVDQDQLDKAKEKIQVALNTLVTVEALIPLPVAAAQSALKDAEVLAQKKDRSEDENKRLEAHLKSAKEKLEFAQELGYGTERDFKDLYAQLNDIAVKTQNGKYATGIFEKIKASLSSLSKSTQVAINKRNETKSNRR